MKPLRSLAVVVIVPVLVAGLASCRSTSAEATSPALGPRTLPSSPSGGAAASPLKPPGGYAKGEGKLPDPNSAPGQLIVITDSGLRPALLVSTVQLGIRWHNESASTQRVLFDNGTVDSGPIPPGQSFIWAPQTTVAITYQVLGATPVKGVIQVEPPLMPGEKPFKNPPKNYPAANWPYKSPSPSA